MNSHNQNQNRMLVSLLALFLIVHPVLAEMSRLKTPDRNTGAVQRRGLPERGGNKLAPDLEELLAQDDEKVKESKSQRRTLAEARAQKLAARKVFNGLAIPSESVLPEEKQSFIVRLDGASSVAGLKAKVAQLGGTVRQAYGSGLVSIEIPRTAVRQLSADRSIAYISPDRVVTTTSGHVEDTTGTTQVRTQVSTGLDGTGIGVAVIDSGVDPNHNLLKVTSGRPGVVYSQDFTGQGTAADQNGHGTHIATLIAGRGDLASGAYKGIAPAVKLINLRVLNDKGEGSASSVINAINWCITNKATYNIRVINLSLGTLAEESFWTDPLCDAAWRANQNGILVVAAAGNDGRDIWGRKLYGLINSPANDPTVLTVGASNTFGTVARSDDRVTTYSSRGPTRSYSVDAYGQKKYDNIIKPDLVAPGNRLIGACSVAAQTNANSLWNRFPLFRLAGSTTADNLLNMSGTSMSTGTVSAAAALLFQINPTMTPSLVKSILMYTAQPLTGFNNFEQGAGQLNLDGAVRIAKLVAQNPASLANGASMLTGALPVASSTIAGQSFPWAQGVIADYCYLLGSNLMTKWQRCYGNGFAPYEATIEKAGALTLDTYWVSTGITTSAGSMKVNGNTLTTNTTVVSSGAVLSDGVVIADGAVLADGVVVSDGVVIADGVVVSDCKVTSDMSISGDNTPGMTYVRLQ